MNLKLTQNGYPSQTINLSATGVRFVTRHKVTPSMEFDLNPLDARECRRIRFPGRFDVDSALPRGAEHSSAI